MMWVVVLYNFVNRINFLQYVGAFKYFVAIDVGIGLIAI